MAEFWFFVAAVEFLVIILTLFLTRAPKSSQKQSKGIEPRTRKIGIIRNLKFVRTALGGDPVTVFEIHSPDGSIFHAAMAGHASDLTDNYQIEYWPTKKVIANTTVAREKENPDGTKSRWKEELKYTALAKYRILPEESEANNDTGIIKDFVEELQEDGFEFGRPDFENWKPEDRNLI